MGEGDTVSSVGAGDASSGGVGSGVDLGMDLGVDVGVGCSGSEGVLGFGSGVVTGRSRDMCSDGMGSWVAAGVSIASSVG